MVRRFLEYSLRRNRAVKLVWMDDAGMKSGGVRVVRLGETDFDYLPARGKTPRTMRVADVLSAAYARGDDGGLEPEDGREAD